MALRDWINGWRSKRERAKRSRESLEKRKQVETDGIYHCLSCGEKKVYIRRKLPKIIKRRFAFWGGIESAYLRETDLEVKSFLLRWSEMSTLEKEEYLCESEFICSKCLSEEPEDLDDFGPIYCKWCGSKTSFGRVRNGVLGAVGKSGYGLISGGYGLGIPSGFRIYDKVSCDDCDGGQRIRTI